MQDSAQPRTHAGKRGFTAAGKNIPVPQACPLEFSARSARRPSGTSPTIRRRPKLRAFGKLCTLDDTNCGGAGAPVILPAFKAGDSALRESNVGFDSHTLPPFSCSEAVLAFGVQKTR